MKKYFILVLLFLLSCSKQVSISSIDKPSADYVTDDKQDAEVEEVTEESSDQNEYIELDFSSKERLCVLKKGYESEDPVSYRKLIDEEIKTQFYENRFIFNAVLEQSEKEIFSLYYSFKITPEKRDLGQINDDLKNEDVDVKVDAVLSTVNLSEEEAYSVLKSSLYNKDLKVVLASVFAIGKRGELAGLDLLTSRFKALNKESENVAAIQIFIAMALARISKPGILDDLNHNPGSPLQDTGEKGLYLFRELSLSLDPGVLVWTAFSGRALGEEALLVLSNLLKSKHASVQNEALRSLKYIGKYIGDGKLDEKLKDLKVSLEEEQE